jgi:hypothetical protein
VSRARRALAGCLLLAGASLAACQSAPPAAAGAGTPARADGARAGLERAGLDHDYAAYASAGEHVIALDPARSQVRIYAFRGGRAARLGHDHVLSAPHFAGYFHAPGAGSAGAGFDLLLRLDELAVDEAPLRAALGGAFGAVLDEGDVAATREHLLGAEGFQADRFPEARVHSLRIVGDAPRFAAQLRIEMHGRAVELWVPLQVQGLPAQLSASGSFVLHQGDFGVTPYSLFGGLLRVEDEIVVEFHLVGG